MSTRTREDRRRIAPGRRILAFGGCERRQGPAADKRHDAAEKDMTERERLVEQQPKRQEAAASSGKGKSRVMAPPALRRLSLGRWQDAPDVFPRRVQRLGRRLHEAHDGPGLNGLHRARSRRTATGAISIRRTRGTARSGGAQKARMPARVMAMSAANPDRISMTSNAHETAGTGPPPWAVPGGLSAAVRSANLAMKPDSGGSPAITSAHPMKAGPAGPSWPGWRCRLLPPGRAVLVASP